MNRPYRAARAHSHLWPVREGAEAPEPEREEHHIRYRRPLRLHRPALRHLVPRVRANPPPQRAARLVLGWHRALGSAVVKPTPRRAGDAHAQRTVAASPARPHPHARAHTRRLSCCRDAPDAPATISLLAGPNANCSRSHRRYNVQINAYHPRPKEWVKTQIFNHLRRQAAS